MSEGPTVEVIGGVGGTAVNVAELGELGRLVRRAARCLDAVRLRLRRAEAELVLGAGLAPSSAAQAAAAAAAAGAVLAALAAEADALAGDLGTALAGYARAESVALDHVVATLVRVGSPLSVPLRPPLPSAGAADRIGLAMTVPALVLGALPSGTAAAVLTPGEPVADPAPPVGVADLMARIEAIYATPGALAVTRVTAADGATSWVVHVPGTQTLAPGGVNPMDNATNAAAFVGLPTATAAAVAAALGMAGARKDEPVLLAGHSQGGMTAMRVAADPRVREQARVTAVVTAGSPVGHVATPPGVRVLHLEHVDDPVPALDGTTSPDEADRVTVRVPAPRTGAGAHAVSAYVLTGELVDASTHPSVSGWRDDALEVFGGPGAQSTTTVYVAERMS